MSVLHQAPVLQDRVRGRPFDGLRAGSFDSVGMTCYPRAIPLRSGRTERTGTGPLIIERPCFRPLPDFGRGLGAELTGGAEVGGQVALPVGDEPSAG